MSSDNNKLILVGLAVGAFWIMSRQRVGVTGTAGIYRGNTGTNNSATGSTLNGAANLLNAFGKLFGGNQVKSPATAGYNPSPAQAAAAAAAANRDEDPSLNGGGSVTDLPAADGIAANPPNSSAYDFTAYQLAGTGMGVNPWY